MATTRTMSEVFDSTDLVAEVKAMALEIVDGWYPADDGPIDWDDVWDRLDGSELSTGDTLDVGSDLLAPELTAIKSFVRAQRRA